MDNSLISVIVPVYNVEKYIRKCVDSIIKQSYENLEIILVDDGSTDLSGEICDQYAELDKRIKVIHKSNGGLSDARNVALDDLNGEYVTFVDSDDYVDKDYISKLYSNLIENSAQISVCNEQRFYLENNKEIKISSVYPKAEDNFTGSGIEGIREFLYQERFDTSACGKLYTSVLFMNVRYPKGKTYEDLATTYKLFLQCDRISYFNERLYYYLQRKNSMVHQTNLQALFDGVEIVEQLDLLKEKYQELIEPIECRKLSMYFHVFFSLDWERNEKEIKCLWEKMKFSRKIVFFDTSARKKTKVASCLSLGGAFLTYKLGMFFVNNKL